MFRFTIRDVLWLTVVVALPAAQLSAEPRPDDIGRSWWEIKETYSLGKPSGLEDTAPSVGFLDGKLYFEDTTGVVAYAVTVRAADEGTRFEFREGERVRGKGLLVMDEKGAAYIFINHSLKERPMEIGEPKADLRTTMETYYCRRLTAEEGRKRLSAHGIEVDGK